MNPCFTPQTITSGDSLSWTENVPAYPAGGIYTLTLWLALKLGTTAAPTSFVAAASGTLYLFTVTPAQNILDPGEYRYSQIITATNVSRTVAEGTLYVLPNFTKQQTPTFAQLQVALLQGALAEFAKTTRLTVNFNGQSFTRASIKDYQQQLVYWQSVVVAEARKLDSLRGGPDAFRLDSRFGPVFNDCPREGAPWNR